MEIDLLIATKDMVKRARASVARVRSLFRTAADVEAFSENEDAYVGSGLRIRAGTPIWAAVEDDEIRKLEDQPVHAVLFTIGDTWLWMPRSEFHRVAQKTSAPEPRFNTFP